VGEKIFSSLIPYGEANVLLGIEAIETLRYIEYLEPNGIIILNNYMWQPVQSTYDRVQEPSKPYITIDDIISQLNKVTDKIYVIDALDLANQAGNPLTSNIVLLGALAKTKNFPITLDQLKQALPQVVPKKAIEANLKAIELGYGAIK
jgi:indolepyruvate ferredoxin oxidoreductase beta subunit